jgi:hypothetical protein
MLTAPRQAAAFGLAYLVLKFTALALAPIPNLGSGSDGTRGFLSDSDPQKFLAGAYLGVLAYVSLLLFVVLLLTTHGSPRVLATAASGSTLALGCVTAGLALALAVVRTAPVEDTSRALLEAAGVLTWASQVGLAVTLLALAGANLARVPEWLSLAARVIALAMLALLPLAATGVSHVPAVLLDLWVLVTAALLLTRRDSRSTATIRATVA